MAMGTPPERYDSEQASFLLKSRGDEAINIATRNLLSRGILSKLQRDPRKQRPGRQLKISEMLVRHLPTYRLSFSILFSLAIRTQ